MARLLFEIWKHPSSGSVSFGRVSRESDELRAQTEPGAVLLGNFHAESDFEAFQRNHDWHGLGRWTPEPDWIERFFSDEEAAEQASYLRRRLTQPD